MYQKLVWHVLMHVHKHVQNFMYATVADMAYKQDLASINTRTHKLTISGGKNYSLILPVEFVRHLKWRERQKLNITLEKDRLIIEDWKK